MNSECIKNKIRKYVDMCQKKLRICASCLLVFLFINLAASHADTVLKGTVSIDRVPKEFYGTWRVSSKLVSTNSEGLFKKSTVDLWNLSRMNDVITLDNPFSGAHASIMLDDIKGQAIKFKKVGNCEDNKKLTDTVQLTLGQETFTGVNYIKLDTISDGHVIKTETATYDLRGEKISGTNIK